jgi:putative holliday junction resolvase
MRIMAIDTGAKRIGIALSDPLGIFANPRGYIDAGDEQSVIREIGRIIEENSVGALIVGLPRNMDGTLGFQAEEAMRFAQVLREHISIPVEMVDERLSSKEAKGLLIEAGVRRKKRRQVQDKIAATIILQKYLDMQKKDISDAGHA